MNPFKFKDMPLRKKITVITVITTLISLLTACLIFILNERFSFPKVMIRNLSNLAQIVGDNSTAALTFNDRKTAQGLLDSLKANPHILLGVLYNSQGEIFAAYRSGNEDVPAYVPRRPAQTEAGGTGADSVHIGGGKVQLIHDIFLGTEQAGILYLESDMEEMQARLVNYSMVTVFVGLLAFFISLLVASRLQHYVTEPLRQVVDRMKDIARGEGDLTKRLEVVGKDEIGEVAEAFNAFVGKLQTVADMKLDLISVVSHQLKTPVAEINGFIENMLEGLTGELNARQKRYLGEMRLIGRENYRLIGDLLSASKIDRGVVSADLKPVSARDVVTLAIRDYEQIMVEKGLGLHLEGMEENIKLYADRDKVVEALRNLINNAIKCTDKGTVTIRIGTEGDQGVIEVKDTGIGMDDDTMGRLFTKNRVLGKEAHRSGAGLGLYISKHFMKIQKGDITVTSEVGKGSCFKLVVPKLKEQEGTAA